MEGFISGAWNILLQYFRSYKVAKTAILNYITPFTDKFDLVDILLVWSVIVVILTVIYRNINYARKYGFKKTLNGWFFRKLKKFSFITNKIDSEIAKMASSLEADIQKHRDPSKTSQLPKTGISEEALVKKLAQWQKIDHKIYGEKKITGCIYYNESEKLQSIVKDVAKEYFYTNPLHFDLFPTANQMEGEVIYMVKNLYNGDDKSCGILTSGGTESIMIAMLAYREQGRVNGIFEPEIVAPITAHVAFEKAAFYYGMRMKWVPVDIKTGIVNPADIKSAISKDTVCVIGSYPNYPYGTCDPIEDLAEIARRKKVGFHTDCCLGGFVAPFAEKFGAQSQVFDFRVKGVTSISVDPHKYGLTPKGVSVVLFNDRKLRAGSFFSCTTWPGGIYTTPTHAGSRGHAPVAGAWVALQYTGYNGYMDKAGKIIEATRRVAKKISEIPELQVVGNPQLGSVAFIAKTKKLSIYDLVDKIGQRGWKLAALQNPPAVHLSITNFNISQVEDFIASVKWGVTELLKSPPKVQGELAQIYGSNAKLPESIMQEGAKVIVEGLLKP